jgi:hypothetical protein
MIDPNQGEYTKIDLGSRRKEITLFVDPDITSEPTTEIKSDGSNTVMLAKLYLNRLGRRNQILRHLGKLSTLYVTKVQPDCEDLAQVPTTSP